METSIMSITDERSSTHPTWNNLCSHTAFSPVSFSSRITLVNEVYAILYIQYNNTELYTRSTKNKIFGAHNERSEEPFCLQMERESLEDMHQARFLRRSPHDRHPRPKRVVTTIPFTLSIADRSASAQKDNADASQIRLSMPILWIPYTSQKHAHQ